MKAHLCLHQRDKQQHFLVSFFLLLLLFSISKSIVLSLIVSVLIGLIKEVWDHFQGTGFCWWDMTANIFGILLALFSLMIYAIFFSI